MVSERDVFVRAQRHLLLQNLFLPWRRRGATLLQVGLRSGLQPDFFWEAGFDVSALDWDKALLDRVRADCSPKVDFFLGRPDHMPFDDSTYDYIVLAHLGLTDRSLLAEALRAASKGVIVLEWNRFSLAAFQFQRDMPRVFPWSIRWMARQECSSCRVRLMSVLPLPPFTWPGRTSSSSPEAAAPRKRRRAERVHDVILPLPLGAIMGMTVELEPVLFTPLGAVTEALRAAAGADQQIAGARRADSLRDSAPGERAR